MEFNQRVSTYIDETAPKPAPKHIFSVLCDLISADPAKGRHMDEFTGQGMSLYDAGCACGDFIDAVNTAFPDMACTGLDYLETFVDQARRDFDRPGNRFVQGDILAYQQPAVDIVTCLGVLGVFEDCEAVLDHLIRSTKPGGRLYVHALFNPDDIDVVLRYRDNLNKMDWNGGFNIFSQARILRHLKPGENGSLVDSVTFHPFLMPFALDKRPDQPHRAHTVQWQDGSFKSINGLCQVLPEHILEIKLRDQQV